jgi:hypothetical protein
MKLFKVIRALFGAAGLCAAVLCIALSFQKTNVPPVLVEQPESAREQVEILMDAVRENNYAGASAVIRGNPVFGADREPADPVGALIWDAFVQSIHYELVGEMYATDSGVAQNLTVTALDISSVTGNLKERSTHLLEERVQAAEDTDEVYDEKNEYREDFVMQVLYDAAAQILKEDARTATYNITINMVYEHGRWWIVSNSDLLSVISGGVLK